MTNAFRSFQSRVLRGFRQDDHELFAAVAADDVFGSDGLAEGIGNLAQDAVTGFMTIGIVEFLEVVYVEHQDGNVGVIPRGPAYFAIERDFHEMPVVKIGEAVS